MRITDVRGLAIVPDEMLDQAGITMGMLEGIVGDCGSIDGYAAEVLQFLSLLKTRCKEGGRPKTFTLTTFSPPESEREFNIDFRLGDLTDE